MKTENNQKELTEKDVLQEVDDCNNQLSSEGAQESKSIFIAKTMNEWLQEAKEEPDPRFLFSPFWYEGEVVILFADTGIGKTIFTVQLVNAICNGTATLGQIVEVCKGEKTVLFFDCELSKKQQQMRYTNSEGEVYQFPDNLIRVELNYDQIPDDVNGKYYLELLRKEMERMIQQYPKGTVALVIDNITALVDELESSRKVRPFLNSLRKWKIKYDCSIMVIGHVPKIPTFVPINLNHLHGSKSLSGLIDGVAALGKSAQGKNLVYFKVLKSRDNEILNDKDNVAVFERGRENGFLGFKFIGYGSEDEHLERQTRIPQAQRDEVLALLDKGVSKSEIERITGISRRTVIRIAQKSASNQNDEDAAK